MVSKRDYYEVLGVAQDADADTIKAAYRRLAMRYHPDRNPGDPEAETCFKEAAEAYEILRDPAKRQRYDRYGHQGLEEMGMPDFGSADSVMDLFGELFGFGGGRRRRGPRPGRDMQVVVDLTLEEAAQGKKHQVTLTRNELCQDCSGKGMKPGSQLASCRRCNGHGVVLQGAGFFRIQQTCGNCGGRGSVITDPCNQCQGGGYVPRERTLTVTLPPGVDTDMSVRVPGEGEAGDPGAPAGNLYCTVRIREHPLFVRQGNDLHCEIPVTFSQAALGGKLDVPILEGKMVEHSLPRGTQSGDQVQLRGQGMPDVHTGRKGNLVLHIRVITPRNLTRRQEELLRELDELDGKHIQPERKSFLERIRGLFGSNASE